MEFSSDVGNRSMFFILQGKISQNFRASYTETLGKLETQYCKLMVSGLGVGPSPHPCSPGGKGARPPLPAGQGRAMMLCCVQETSGFRLRHLQSLHGFVSRATAELIWLNEKEEEELAYDWSDNNPNIAAKRNYFSVSDHGAGWVGLGVLWVLLLLWIHSGTFSYRQTSSPRRFDAPSQVAELVVHECSG